MFIVVTKPCCKRMPFEPHKKDCYYAQQKKAMAKYINSLFKQFEKAIKN